MSKNRSGNPWACDPVRDGKSRVAVGLETMLDSLLDAVKNAIYADSTTPQTPGNDPSGLIAEIEGLFRRHVATQPGSPAYADGGPVGEIPRLQATEDPYGDPAPTFGTLR